MADGLKFSLTVIFPDTPTNMTSIRPILTSFPGSLVCSTANGQVVLTVDHRMGSSDTQLFAVELWDLMKELVPPFIEPKMAELLDLIRLADITGNMKLTLEFEPE